MVTCKFQKYKPKEQFINRDKGYDRIMISCAISKELCPAQVECSSTEQFVLSTNKVKYCKNYQPLM